MAERLGEFERIARFFKPLSAVLAGAYELSDDAGVIAPAAGQELVVTTDALVEGIHVLPGERPDRLARKALRVNLSDLAAMGARPLAYTLALALPAAIGDDWLAAFAGGLADDQTRFAIGLLGGDSVSTGGPVVVSVTAIGTVACGRALRRAGAVAGDRIYVSGTLGDAALGLRAARGELAGVPAGDVAALAARYHEPEPRLALGHALAGVATAAIDVSDGLVGDLGHVCAASGVGARVEAARVPLSPAGRHAVRDEPALGPVALAGGDDYELLFTVPPEAEAGVADLARHVGLPLTAIGEMTTGSGVVVLDETGRPIAGLAGWTHT